MSLSIVLLLVEPIVPEKTIVSRLRVGAVRYLNSKPLIFSLARLAPEVEIVNDYPSRLADGLASGCYDLALVPSIEYVRQPGCTIVSDACVACLGPVRSVKLYSRVPIERIRRLALDEGSRTSATLVRILLAEQYGLRPELVRLPLGAEPESPAADAVMLIGDRGMLPPPGEFAVEWDLGEQWLRWTGLPFVFAMWIARPGLALGGFDRVLEQARDEGRAALEEIARRSAPEVGLPEAECLAYLRDNLHFRLDTRERQGLQRFYRLAGQHGLAPAGVELVFHDRRTA